MENFQVSKWSAVTNIYPHAARILFRPAQNCLDVSGKWLPVVQEYKNYKNVVLFCLINKEQQHNFHWFMCL